MRLPVFGTAASDALERCLRLSPANPYCSFDRITLYVLTSDFDGAIKLYSSLRPSIQYPWFDEPFGLALYGKGQFEQARNVLSAFSKTPRTHGLTKFTTGREWLAGIDFFQGKITEASSQIEVLLPADNAYGMSTHYLYLARVNALISNEAQARNMALKAISQLDERGTRVEAGAIVACTEYQKDAEKILHLANGTPIADLSASTQTLLNGCKALSADDYAKAVQQFQTSYHIADDLDTEFFLAKAYIGARRWEEAKVILKDLESKGRIIADEVYPPVIWPLTLYYSGIAYEQSGDSEKAISYYSQFLDCWKDGDASLKISSDAAKRVARLRNSKRAFHALTKDHSSSS